MAKPNGKDANVLLAVDVGNTQTSLGAFSDGALLATWTLTTPERLTADEAFETAFTALERMARRASFDVRNRATGVDASVRETSSAGALSLEPDLVDDAVISCVVPDLAAPWQEALRRLTGRRPLTVGPGIKTGVRMKYRDPAEIGADRMADLAALLADYAPPAIVVDLGTTTNFEVVDAEGVFLGGIIAPGMALGARSLAARAAKLPVVEIAAPKKVIGTCTREAMQSGVVLGEIARIDGLLGMIEREHPADYTVVVTGTDAASVAPLLGHEARADATLTLRGLARLHELNRR